MSPLSTETKHNAPETTEAVSREEAASSLLQRRPLEQRAKELLAQLSAELDELKELHGKTVQTVERIERSITAKTGAVEVLKKLLGESES